MVNEIHSIPTSVYDADKDTGLIFQWRELWDYRELLFFLTWRDVLVRYKQTVLGVTWALLQPLLTVLIFSVIFGKFAGLPSDGVPYPLFSLAALLPWQLFSGALNRAGTSLVGNSNLITKIYFPRLLIPLSAVLAGMIDFGISFVVFLGLMLYYRIPITISILALPLLIILALLTALAVGLWLSALNVQYRDVQYAIPFIIQALMYASPVAYSAQMIPAGLWRYIYGLNPIAGVIQGFRWALLGSSPPDGLFIISLIMIIVLFVSGLFYFQKMEARFADVV